MRSPEGVKMSEIEKGKFSAGPRKQQAPTRLAKRKGEEQEAGVTTIELQTRKEPLELTVKEGSLSHDIYTIFISY